jgi:hypothetical protein
MNIGDHVTIEWPGDTIAFKVPEGKVAGDTVKLKIASLLKIITTDAVPVVAVGTSLPSGVSDIPYHQRRVQARRGTYVNPTRKQCRDCGATIFLWHSGRTDKWYPCDSPSQPGSFHSKTCTARKQAATP